MTAKFGNQSASHAFFKVDSAKARPTTAAKPIQKREDTYSSSDLYKKLLAHKANNIENKSTTFKI